MKYSGFKIGRIPVTAKLLLYALLTISVISGVIGSALTTANISISLLGFFVTILVAILAGIGFVAIILEAAKRWSLVGGGIFIGFALFILFSLPYGYNEAFNSHRFSPFILATLVVWNVSWLISGIIIIFRGKDILTVK
jgi:hypothetical protein